MSFSLRHFREGRLPSPRDRQATAPTGTQRLHDRVLSRSGRARDERSAAGREQGGRGKASTWARLSMAPRIGHSQVCPAQAVSEGAPMWGLRGGVACRSGRWQAGRVGRTVRRQEGVQGETGPRKGPVPPGFRKRGTSSPFGDKVPRTQGRDFYVIVKDRAVTLSRERRPSCRG